MKLTIPIIMAILAFALLSILSPSITGNIVYDVPSENDFQCFYYDSDGGYFIEDIDACCNEVSQQLHCEETTRNGFILDCYVSKDGASYLLNEVARRVCNDGLFSS